MCVCVCVCVVEFFCGQKFSQQHKKRREGEGIDSEKYCIVEGGGEGT